MTIKVGLTGNIGSGKSTVARLFEMMGVPVFYADLQARAITEKQDILAEIQKAFGNSVVDESGRLDRKALASIVFNDSDKLAVLNAIIHPRVGRSFSLWCAQHDSAPYILHESAILFESGLAYLCDKVIIVSAPEEVRLNRVMQRDHLSREAVLNRMLNQWAETKLIYLSDYKIVNDDCMSLIEQVKIIDSSLNSTII